MSIVFIMAFISILGMTSAYIATAAPEKTNQGRQEQKIERPHGPAPAAWGGIPWSARDNPTIGAISDSDYMYSLVYIRF